MWNVIYIYRNAYKTFYNTVLKVIIIQVTTTWVKKLNTLRAIQALLPIQHLLFPGGSDCDLPATQKAWVQSLGWEDSLEKGMATHCRILAWEFSMDRGAWWAIVHGVAKSWTWLSDSHTHTHTHTHNFFRDGQKRKRFLPRMVHNR